MAPHNYEPLRQDPVIEKHTVNGYQNHGAGIRPRNRSHSTAWILTLSLLAISMTINLITLTPKSIWPQTQTERESSYFASLSRNVTKMIAPDGRSVDDEMWNHPHYDINHGLVALDDKYVQEHNLPPAQRYPWDASRSIYLLHGFHAMHCVLVFRQLIIEARDNTSHMYSTEHMTHCLQALREDVECRADDLPRFVGRFGLEKDSPVVHPGHGQNRQCRDWDQLHRFALENTACYDESHLSADSPVIEAYKNCPDGRTPWIKDREDE